MSAAYPLRQHRPIKARVRAALVALVRALLWMLPVWRIAR